MPPRRRPRSVRRNPSDFEFRVTNERGWEHRFHARDPKSLARGITAGWIAWVNRNRPHGAAVLHPRLELNRRLDEIRKWYEERMSRAGTSEAQRNSWETNARHWIYQARSDYGDPGVGSPLRLHVKSEVVNQYMPPWNRLPAAAVHSSLRPDVARNLWNGSVMMVEHDKMIQGFAASAAEMVKDPPRRRGRLRLVR